jgi:trehalose utilization protein
MAPKIRVTVWSEFRHEKQSPEIAKIYPEGMHGAIAAGLKTDPQFEVRTATLDEPEHGLTKKALAETDVLTWWGHMAHDEVKDEIITRVQERIIEGMGLIVLHSGHYSKMFKRMMGTSCALRWREANEKERLWVVEPGHPIVDGLPPYFELPHEEMYGERFDIPNPDAVVFIGWFAGGDVFRSGCTFTRGKGRIFYFQPGHETYPIYFDRNVRKVIANAARWAAPGDGPVMKLGDSEPPLEKL